MTLFSLDITGSMSWCEVRETVRAYNKLIVVFKLADTCREVSHISPPPE